MSEHPMQEKIIPEQIELVKEMKSMGYDKDTTVMAVGCLDTPKMITQFRKWLEKLDYLPSQFETMSEVERILKENQ